MGIQNNYNSNQPYPEEKTNFIKVNNSKIVFYEIIMVIIFLVFAIPLYLLIYKNQVLQTKNNLVANYNPALIETNFPTNTPTPTPVTIKNLTDLKKFQNDLNNDYIGNFNLFSGIISQFDYTIKQLSSK